MNEMLQIVEREGLKITEIRRESHSVRATGQRPVFIQIINDIRLENLMAFSPERPDRLSRNAGD